MKNDDSPILHHSHGTTNLCVLKHTGFHRNGVIHISKLSVLYYQ